MDRLTVTVGQECDETWWYRLIDPDAGPLPVAQAGGFDDQPSAETAAATRAAELFFVPADPTTYEVTAADAGDLSDGTLPPAVTPPAVKATRRVRARDRGGR